MKNNLLKVKQLLLHKRNKWIIPFVVLSLFGLDLEIFMRAISGSLVGYNGFTYASLMGYTSLIMMPCYGFGAVTISILNEYERFWKLPMFVQVLLNGIIITIIELLYGIFFNLYPFHLNLWHYDGINFMHQICLQNFILFTLVTPFCIWICDYIGYVTYDEGEEYKYNLWQNYKDLFTGK